MTAIAGLRTRAVLQAAAEAETALGGRTVGWADVAVLWVAMGAAKARERAPGGREARDVSAPERLELRCEAQARDHPLAARGQRLVADGVAWRVVAVERPGGGRMRLALGRD